MSFQIPQDDEKYDYVQDRFSKIAEKYDLFNDVVTQGMHRYWKNFMVRLAELRLEDQALDICCGTGDILERLARQVGLNGKAVGLDFSKGMIKTALTRDAGPQSFLLQGDAMKLPFADQSFHAVTVGYGLRNLVKIEPCLEEVLRVLKPGGRFLCLDMGKVKTPLVKQFFDFYFFKMVPVVGKTLYPGEDMFDYFPASTKDFPSQEKLAQMIGAAGFKKVKVYNFAMGATAIHLGIKAQE